MTRRYDEPVHVRARVGPDGSRTPTSFTWRGETYRINRVLGEWTEEPLELDASTTPLSEVWRVAARTGTSAPGTYELLLRGGRWRLHRIWD